jgi:transposase-like protein
MEKRRIRKMVCPNCSKEAKFVMIEAREPTDAMFGNKHIFRCDDCHLKFEIMLDDPNDFLAKTN